ncbi:MAG TPA: DUF4159 domain-containing protein [Tepidisphaeraceae bacterium]|nr:DUF4159 domain-containing protein [Tepidisphaeraceae bacterium]
MARWTALLICLTGLMLMPAPAHADDATITNDQITAAVKKAVGWVYNQQNDWGTWETVHHPNGTERDRLDAGQFGELTALATHTLLAAGESDRDPRIARAVQFLMGSQDITGVYAVGMRAQVWPQLERSAAARQAMAADRTILLQALHHVGRTRGLFSFRSDFEAEPDYADHGVSLYGVMGLKALADGGIEIPDEVWHLMDHAWRSQQQKDGSWVFRIGAAAKQEHTMSMTASGVAVLFATTDELAASGTVDCQGVPVDRNIERGLNWIDAHFDQSRDPHQLGEYTVQNFGLYAIARIGVISGRKYFNQRDWYQDGAKMLLDAQDPITGAWNNVPDTCLAILFLVRGRDPVILSKLQYASNATTVIHTSKSSRGGRAETWNLRPRDVANITDWIGRQVETDFKWQSVGLQVPVEELHDSAILYVSGNRAIQFNEDEKRKLKTFMEEGGLVLGVADCASPDFSRSFRALGEELFPDYEFRNVPPESVIYTNEEYRADSWETPPKMLELNNGVRDLMLLIPEGDPGRHFQLRQVGSWRKYYELMADIVFYSFDKDGMRLKGDTYIVRPDPSISGQRTVKIARLKYNGNWNPEPRGWIRLSAIMHNTRGIDLNVQAIRPGEGQLDSSYKVAHLTGTSAFHFSDEARAEIKRYVDGGGTLVIDAAGGSAAFAASAEAEVKAMYPDSSLDLLAPESPVFSAGRTLTRALYRRLARDRIGETTDFRLRGYDIGARTAIFFSAEDLSAGLVGEPIDGIYGYQPSTACDLMANLICYAAPQ